ncbi:carbohydrate ABC transporter permease [Clostridium tertium]|jgi:multiple sugar transport system permease protein|uniref:carbohydrate ABC transporter permease n=1 Tax=Clostridium tertium TaxID=1559 RepID=UPI001596DC69|nr:sugar ABC transporter permease [Clostridium tertium]MBU6136713.1 sugar ABC transporter permease [Clostridium tertium]MDB1941463.1 sugar ABC transporter permease [Clostridium tertium]
MKLAKTQSDTIVNFKEKTSDKSLSNVNRYGYLFILPFLVVFLIFNIYPILRTLYLSFTKFSGYGDITFIGLDNYTRLIKDTMFWNSLLNTVKIWGINVVLQLGLAFLLTIIFSDMKYKMKGLSIFRALFYLPNLIAATSVAFLFGALLDWQFGSLNQILLDSGLISTRINWLGQPGTAVLVVAVIGAWMWFGNSFLVLMAGVQGISKDYYEAATIDGAGRWTIFGKITLPLLKPILLYVAITSLIGGLQIFDIPFLITDGIGSPSGALNTSVMYLYNTAFKYNNVGYAAAIAYGLFFIIAICSAFTFKSMYGSNKNKEVR